MLQFLYPLGFIVSLSGLILWFYNQGNPARSRLMSQAFLGGFMVYLFSLAFSDAAFSNKLWILFRDLMVLGIVSQGFNVLKQYKWLFFGGLGLLYGLFYAFGFQKMSQSIAPASSPLNTVTSTPAKTNAQTKGRYGELLVDMAENHHFGELRELVLRYGLEFTEAFHPENPEQTHLDDYWLVDIPDAEQNKLGELELALMASGLVDWVEENEEIQLSPMESETITPIREGVKYGLNDPEVGQLWGFKAMKVDQLYQFLQQSKIQPKRKALIAILDTGVDAVHEDIKANFKSLDKKHDTDPAGHGTHCAGIAAAVSNNGKGVASFSLQNDFVEVTSIRVLGASGGGTQQSIIKGIIEAADKKVDVISLSLGGPSTPSRQRAYEEAVQYANKAGAIVVVAAGNSNANAAKYGPANTLGVIAVSAIDTLIHRAHFSNYVTELKMGIAAPGVNIFSTIPGSKYAAYNGTSMATPYVAGLLGLMKSIQPQLTTSEAFSIIQATGMDTNKTSETGKLIQPAAAIKMMLKNSLQ